MCQDLSFLCVCSIYLNKLLFYKCFELIHVYKSPAFPWLNLSLGRSSAFHLCQSSICYSSPTNPFLTVPHCYTTSFDIFIICFLVFSITSQLLFFFPLSVSHHLTKSSCVYLQSTSQIFSPFSISNSPFYSKSIVLFK